MHYDILLREAKQHGVDVYEEPMTPTVKGLYADGVIWINRSIPTATEKACILAEELGHHHTSTGNIIDMNDLRNLKQERRARAWAYERLVPLSKIIQAYQNRITDQYELAEYLGVTEQFLQQAIDYYLTKHGQHVVLDKHIIFFDPLAVIEISKLNISCKAVYYTYLTKHMF